MLSDARLLAPKARDRNVCCAGLSGRSEQRSAFRGFAV